jgi:hypothetical protein
MATYSQSADCMCPPVRNRYFYGKLLDVLHFDMEQKYFNEKRWLLNRLVAGYGVICGLNVTLGSDGQSVVVSPGVAIDKCGKEIIVCQPSDPFPLPAPQAPNPASQGGGTAVSPPGSAPSPATNGGTPAPPLAPPPPPDPCSDTGTYKHLVICFHECPADPSPALGGDCDTQSMCTPGSIRERYCLKLCDGKLCPASTTSSLQSVLSGGALNYSMLATYVANLQCCSSIDDCCIPLANIQIPVQPSTYTANSIDISIRPLVYTADMLYELLLACMNQGQPQLRGGK